MQRQLTKGKTYESPCLNTHTISLKTREAPLSRDIDLESLRAAMKVLRDRLEEEKQRREQFEWEYKKAI